MDIKKTQTLDLLNGSFSIKTTDFLFFSYVKIIYIQNNDQLLYGIGIFFRYEKRQGTYKILNSMIEKIPSIKLKNRGTRIYNMCPNSHGWEISAKKA